MKSGQFLSNRKEFISGASPVAEKSLPGQSLPSEYVVEKLQIEVQRHMDAVIFEAGKRLVQILQVLDIPSAEGKEYDELLVKLREVKNTFRQILGEQWRMSETGFLAEYAVAYAIAKEIGDPVLYPTREDDLEGKIDWWVDLTDTDYGGAVALSVKCLRLSDKLPKMVWHVDDDKEMRHLIGELSVLRLKDDRTKLLEKIELLRQEMTRYIKERYPDEKISPVLVVLPSPYGDNAVFNSISGTPGRELVDELWDLLDRLTS